MVTASSLTSLIDMAAGREPADLLITNGRIVDVFSREIVEGSLAIGGGRILGIGEYQARQTIDANGLYILPGLIDAHVHIESSLLTPCFFCSNRATLWNYYGCSRSS